MQINWLSCNFNHFDGYGKHALSMIRALSACGVEVQPISADMLNWPGWLRSMTSVDFSRLTISLMPPQHLKAIPGRQWCFTMYESTKIPEAWPKIINRLCERLIVPSPWLVKVFEDNGVKVPIHVVQEGIWPEEWPLVNGYRPNRPYTFMTMGDRGSRKAHDLAWRAFYECFGDDPDVRLIIKVRKNGMPLVDLSQSDPRVSIWREDADNLSSVFAMADCFVFPSRGEGWGLPPREAAAMGLPVIVTKASGLEVGLPHWGYSVGYTMSESRMPAGGQWFEADVDQLADKMRWCYEHQTEARQFGHQAAHWLRENQTWTQAGQAMKKLLEERL
jgi:glycosyltransferase involved in cell wall biosynthesis